MWPLSSALGSSRKLDHIIGFRGRHRLSAWAKFFLIEGGTCDRDLCHWKSIIEKVKLQALFWKFDEVLLKILCTRELTVRHQVSAFIFIFRVIFFSVWRISRPAGFFVLLNFSSNCDMNQRKRLIFQFPIIKKLDSSILGFKKLRIFDVKSKFLDDRWFNENFAGEHSRKFCTFWKKYIQFDTENSVFEVKITSSYEIFSARTLSWILAGFWAEFHIRARIKIKFFSGPKNPGRKFLGRVAVAEP